MHEELGVVTMSLNAGSSLGIGAVGTTLDLGHLTTSIPTKFIKAASMEEHATVVPHQLTHLGDVLDTVVRHTDDVDDKQGRANVCIAAAYGNRLRRKRCRN